MKRRIPIQLKPKQSKYRAVRTEVNGFKFASKREAARYQELDLMRKSGTIVGLCLQVKYDLIVNTRPVGRYIADFVYLDENNEVVVEDVKGVRTPIYRLKKKLMQAIYGLEIKEV